MKNYRIDLFCGLLLLMFCLLMGESFYSGFSSAMASFRQSGSDYEHTSNISVRLKPAVKYSYPDSIWNASESRMQSYRKEKVSLNVKNRIAEASSPGLFGLLKGLLALLIILVVLFFLVWSVTAFYRFIRDVKKRQIFTKDNVRRLRAIGYGLFTMGIIGNLLNATKYYQLQEEAVSFPGYELDSFWISYKIFIIAFLFVLFAEVFSVGVKMKEDQDLTV